MVVKEIFCVACKRKYRVDAKKVVIKSGRNLKKFEAWQGRCPKGHTVTKIIKMITR